jgi:methionyl-tRNA synthetase
MSSYYITTPIYYVNDVPHIGHAYTSVASDVLARFMRLDGRDVKFLTGTDEHGQKVEKSAEKAGIDPQTFTDNVSVAFRNLGDLLNLSNDDFIRTTEERHKIAAQALWKKLEENGAIYLGKYAGWYSVRDEAFYAESELIDKMAPTGAPVEWVEEPSYFFALSKFQDKLLEFYEQNPGFICPSSRKNEVVSFVKSGLHDLSVSRTSFKWGIPVPRHCEEDSQNANTDAATSVGSPRYSRDDASEHIMYVWLDALTNYMSAVGYPNLDSADFTKFWPADLHIIGKDILRFHAVYWPAFLMAADLALPKRVFAHGWWTNDGQKMSKSIGNVVSPEDLIEEFGRDPVRYFLMREMIFGNDGNYSRSSLIARINSELANNIGNLAQRTLSFVQKNADGIVPLCHSTEGGNPAINCALLELARSLRPKFVAAMEEQDINSVLDGAINLASEANIYIDQKAPWNLKKTDPEEMKRVLYVLLEVLRYIGIYMQPFTPTAAAKLLDLLAISKDQRSFSDIEKRLIPGTKLPEPEPIFPRFV